MSGKGVTISCSLYSFNEILRFFEDRYSGLMSSWIRNRMAKYDKFNNAISACRAFFTQCAMNPELAVCFAYLLDLFAA